MVSFGPLASLLNKAPVAAKVAQPASRGLQAVKPAAPLSKAKVSDDAAREIAKKPMSVPKKVAIGTGAIGGIALLSSGALGSGCESLMGAKSCQFITAPEKALSTLTGLPMQLAEGIVFLGAGAFVIGTTYLAHTMVGNGYLTAGTFTAATFIAVGVVNRED